MYIFLTDPDTFLASNCALCPYFTLRIFVLLPHLKCKCFFSFTSFLYIYVFTKLRPIAQTN